MYEYIATYIPSYTCNELYIMHINILALYNIYSYTIASVDTTVASYVLHGILYAFRCNVGQFWSPGLNLMSHWVIQVGTCDPIVTLLAR